jgi:trehalose utilization protein
VRQIHVVVWGEFDQERRQADVKALYPDGIHTFIANFLRGEDVRVKASSLLESEQGLSQELLDWADVLVWWSHCQHGALAEQTVERVQQRVLDGMGFIALHSSAGSKPFTRLMGTKCRFKWRENDGGERVWAVDVGHPILSGVPESFVIPRTEMYGEPFGIPQPDSVVLMSWYPGGEVLRSGCCFTRGRGRIFYFAPGHEQYPIFYQPEVQRILHNAVRWAAPTADQPAMTIGQTPRPEAF